MSVKAIYLTGLLVMVIVRGKYVLKTKDNEILRSHRDSLEKFLIIQIVAGGFLLPIVYLFTSWLDFANYWLSEDSIVVAAISDCLALYLMWRAHYALGKNWSMSLEIRKGHELITQDIYRRIRLPMYTGIGLWALSKPLLLHNWLAGWSAFVSFLLLLLLRVPREERMMVQEFGDQYRDYMRRTGQIFPRLFERTVQRHSR